MIDVNKCQQCLCKVSSDAYAQVQDVTILEKTGKRFCMTCEHEWSYDPNIHMTQARLVELRDIGAHHEADMNGVSSGEAIECYILPRWEDMGAEDVLEEIASMSGYSEYVDYDEDWEPPCDMSEDEVAFIKAIPASGLPTTRVKWKWKKVGGYIYVLCFTCTSPGETWTNNGRLIFDEAEWKRMINTNGALWVTTEER